MADGGGRSSGSSLQGEHEIKSTTRGQFSEKKSGFHKTVKLIFSMKPVSEDQRNYLTLLIPKIFVVEWLLMFFRVIPDKHFLIWCKEVF